MKILPLILAVISVLMPVIAQKTGLSNKYGFTLKMLCAALYFVTGVLSAISFSAVTEYSIMMLGGLALDVLGDFFLSYKNNRYFAVGALFFALGHMAYAYTFLCFGDYKTLSRITLISGITVAVTAVIVIFAKTKLNLKGKKNMLLVYLPVLVFAFACAFVKGIVAVKAGNPSFGLCLMFGGTLFFLSDIMIGIGKGGIRRPKLLNNAVSYTYFTAQTLFALSILFQ